MKNRPKPIGSAQVINGINVFSNVPLDAVELAECEKAAEKYQVKCVYVFKGEK